MSQAAPPDAGAGARPGDTPAAELIPAADAATAVVPPRAGLPEPGTGVDGGWRFASPLIVLLTAGFVVFASLSAATGGGLAGTTPVELVAMLLGGGLTAAAIATSRDAGLPGGWPLVAFMALATLTALSIWWAIDPNGAWLEADRTIAYAFGFAGAASLARLARGRETAFVGGLLLGVSLMCAYAIGTKIFPEWLNESERFARLREPFGYWNAVGLMGAFTLPGALWLASRRDGSPLVSALAYPALTLGITTMLLAYSRGSLLAAAVGGAVWFALVDRRVRGAATLLTSAGASAFIAAWTFGQDALTDDGVELSARSTAGHELLVLVLAVLVIVYLTGLALAFIADLRPLEPRQRRNAGIALLCLLALTPLAVAGMLATTDDGLGGSVSTAWKTITDPAAEPPANDATRLTETGSIRARYWDDAIRMLEDDHVVVGYGAGGYATARPRFRRDHIDVRHAHGYVPQTLADLGLLGMGISLALLVTWILAARRVIRRTTGKERAALVTLTSVAVVFGFHSFVDWTWFMPGTAFVGMLAAGWVAGAASGSGRVSTLDRRLRLALAGLVALVAVTAAWAAWQPLRSQQASDRVLDLAAESKYDEARAEAGHAAHLNPLSAEPYFSLAIAERRSGDLPAAAAALEHAVDVEPSQASTWLRLAEFRLWVQDDPKGALRAVRAALYLDPASFTVRQRYLDVARTLRNRGG